MMRLFYNISILFCLSALLPGCLEKEVVSFSVTNELDMGRRETISISAERISELLDKYGAEDLLVQDVATDSLLVSQGVDTDGDGSIDELLFQTDIGANETKKFKVAGTEGGAKLHPKPTLTTYSRFVPERTDDYAWENDRVAFRTYGPEAQRLVEEKKPGGTLSSGIDAWLKRVNYSIIDKWYAGYLQEPNYYHIDHGEGYDPYHVGPSRGIGGTGIWENDSIYVSRNFTDYKTIATGPIRTIFELNYAPYEVNGRSVEEIRRISLDLGSNLSYFDVKFNSEQDLQNAAVGITLHNKKGSVKTAPEQGWARYWEPMDGSELGLGLVMDPKYIQEIKDRRTANPDQSHVLLIADAQGGKITYYAGFGWKKSGQFNSVEEWDQYLSDFAKRIQFPLVVKF